MTPLSREVLCTEVPLNNAERQSIWRSKVLLLAMEQWINLTSHERLVELGDPEELPSFLRRQAE